MFPLPALDLLRKTPRGKRSSYGRYQSRVSGLPYNNSEFPVAALAEELEQLADTLPSDDDGVWDAFDALADGVLSKEKARRLKDAVRRIGQQIPGAGRYLQGTLDTGTYCRYRPL